MTSAQLIRYSDRVRTEATTPATPSLDPASSAISMFSGVPDPAVVPHDQLRSAFDAVLTAGSSLSYSRGRGDGPLRELLAARASQRGAATSPNDIVITSGSSGGLAMLASCLLDPGDVVLCEELTYPGATAVFRQAGARVVPVALDGGGLVVEDLADVLESLGAEGQAPKLLYTIANNQSPTTTSMTADRRPRIAELADRFGVIVVQDDTYGDIWFDEDRPGSLRCFDLGRTVHLGSFSKTLAPALRLGWMEAPGHLAEVVATTRNDLGTSSLVQGAVATLLADGTFDAELLRLAAFYREKRDVLLEALWESCGEHVRCGAPHGGFFAWAELDPLLAADQLGKLAAEEGVVFPLGPFFDVRGGRHVPAARLAYGELALDQLREAAARIGRALRQAAAGSGRPNR